MKYMNLISHLSSERKMLFRSLNNFGRFGGLWSSQGGLSKMGSN
jgi:hypothetical protein